MTSSPSLSSSASQNVPSPACGYAALACVGRIRRAFARLHPPALASLRLLGRLGPVLFGALHPGQEPLPPGGERLRGRRLAIRWPLPFLRSGAARQSVVDIAW